MLLEEAGELCSRSPGVITAGRGSRRGTAEPHTRGELIQDRTAAESEGQAAVCFYVTEREYGVTLV